MTADGGTPVQDSFAGALRGAIAARGMSLDQLRRALGRKGVTVSVATLSYWQSGRSKPERSTSLAAIGPLEECLDLPRGFLASRLPSSRRQDRDRRLYEQASLPGSVRRTDQPSAAADLLGLDYADATRVSVHDRVRLDERGQELVHDVRLLLQARRDGVDRYPVWLETDDTSTLPLVTAMTNCRVGRVSEFREQGGVAVEMLLERPLTRGETTLVEHRLSLVGPQSPKTYVWRGVTNPSREVVIEVRFHERRLPSSAIATRVVDGVPEERELEVHRTIQAHFADNPPARFQLTWAW